jgi:uncharacterized protein
MTLYATIPQLIKMLQNVERWLDRGEVFAKEKSFDPAVLLASRLAPDQFPLLRQVQALCDVAKFTAARLTAKVPPKHPDTEQTIEELRERIRGTIDYLRGFKPEDFDGAEERAVELPLFGGKRLLGRDYLTELQLPNFYFHVTTAYAILRHSGVGLGKTDYIGGLNLS